jgi:hypothetical protein
MRKETAIKQAAAEQLPWSAICEKVSASTIVCTTAKLLTRGASSVQDPRRPRFLFLKEDFLRHAPKGRNKKANR